MIAALRDAITDGRFKWSDRLIERDLCELFEASRTTIREALRELEAAGLVRAVPGHGMIVAPLTIDEVDDLYVVRAALEGLAVRLFAVSASDDAVASLKVALDCFVEVSRAGELTELLDTKDAFYAILLRGADNEPLRDMFTVLAARIRQLRKVSLGDPERLRNAETELYGVVEAIRSREPERAEQLSVDHVRAAARTVLSHLRSVQAS